MINSITSNSRIILHRCYLKVLGIIFLPTSFRQNPDTVRWLLLGKKLVFHKIPWLQNKSLKMLLKYQK